MSWNVTNNNGKFYFTDDDKKKIIPISYRSFRPKGGTVKTFQDNDFHLFSVFPSGIKTSLGNAYSDFGEVWVGDELYDFKVIDKQIDMFLQNAPDAKISLMIHLDTRDWFLKEHPEVKNSFFHLAQSADCEIWKTSAKKFMFALVDYVEKTYPKRIFSIFLFAGNTCEWFSATGNEEEFEENICHKNAFSKYMGRDSEIPAMSELLATENGVFRNPKTQSDAINYWKFHSECVADMIIEFTGELKKHTDNNYPIGLFYGYLLGLGGKLLWRGHGSFNRILNCDSVDILFAPAQYQLRGKDSTSGVYIPCGSTRLHNKMYWHEIDNTTHLVNDDHYTKLMQQFAHKRRENQQEDTMYFRRETAVSMAQGYGYWWFDMLGGWYDDEEMMKELVRIRKVSEELWECDMSSCAEIAFLISEESHFVAGAITAETNGLTCNKPQVDVTSDLICNQTPELNRAGLPWDAYMAEDLLFDKFDEDRYKLYIFCNMFYPDEKMIAKIKKLREQGKNILFLYAPGYVNDDGFSVSDMNELTGLEFETLDMERVPNIVTPYGDYGFTGNVSPVFAERSGEVWGMYQDSILPGLTVKDNGNSFVAWSGAGRLPAHLIRKLAQKAGCFIYTDSGNPTYINNAFVGIFAQKACNVALNLPIETQLVEMYTGETVTVVDGKADVALADNELKLYKRIVEE